MWPNIEYKLVILKKGNPPVQVKQLGIDIAKDQKMWRKKTYYYKSEDISYRRGRKYFIYKDMDTGSTILRSDEKSDAPVTPSEPGAEMFKGLIAQAISAIGGNYGLLLVAMVGIACLAGGFLLGASPIGSYFHGNQTVATATKLVALLA